MKFFVSFIIFIALALPVCRSFAQEKKAHKQAVKAVSMQPAAPETLRIIHNIARGARLESMDAKNVFFILRPTGAFIQINF